MLGLCPTLTLSDAPVVIRLPGIFPYDNLEPFQITLTLIIPIKGVLDYVYSCVDLSKQA